MVRGPKAAASRHWLLVVLGLVLPAANLGAAEVPPLVLPIGVALAMVVSAADGHKENASSVATTDPRSSRRGPLGFLPKELHIPNGYDLDYDRPIRSWADPVDRDRIVSVDVFRRTRGWRVSLAYDEESAGVYAGSSQVFGITFEHEF